MFNATRPWGLDGWTMDVTQYELMRQHILDTIDDLAEDDGTVYLKDIVAAAQDRYGKHPSFPNGRLRNYCTYTKVDLEARGEIIRAPGSGAQRLRRTVSPDGPPAPMARRDDGPCAVLTPDQHGDPSPRR